MYTAIEIAIELLAKKINPSIDAGDALKYTQAALNLAHTLCTVKAAKGDSPPDSSDNYL